LQTEGDGLVVSAQGRVLAGGLIFIRTWVPVLLQNLEDSNSVVALQENGINVYVQI